MNRNELKEHRAAQLLHPNTLLPHYTTWNTHATPHDALGVETLRISLEFCAWPGLHYGAGLGVRVMALGRFAKQGRHQYCCSYSLPAAWSCYRCIHLLCVIPHSADPRQTNAYSGILVALQVVEFEMSNLRKSKKIPLNW